MRTRMDRNSRLTPRTARISVRTVLAVAVASAIALVGLLSQAPAANASWGIGGVTFGAFTEDGTEFQVQMRNTFGSDGLHLITGAVGTRSASWVKGPDSAPDSYPIPSTYFLDAGRFCAPEETYPWSFVPAGNPSYPGDPRGDTGGPCWGYAFEMASQPGPWGYGVPVVADGPSGEDLVFDHWDVTGADTAGRCYTGDTGIVGGSGLLGANGQQVPAVGFRGYVDVLNPDASKQGSYSAKAVYAALSPDTSAPIVTIQSDLDCQRLVKGAIFTATYECSDPGLTLVVADSCVGPVPSGAPIDTSTVGTHAFTVTGTDAANNSRSKTVHYTVLAPPPGISISDVSQAEGNAGTTTDTFTVTLDSPYTEPVTVDFATSDGTATAGSDYVATAGTATFAPGITSQQVEVTVNGDTTVELDETFTVPLSNPLNGTVADATGDGTIANDDMPPAVFGGFTSPVTPPSGVNIVQAGQSIPVKFGLGGDFGLSVFQTGYPAWVPMSCTIQAASTPAATPENRAVGILAYSATTQQYSYTWRTDKKWKGTCSAFVVKFKDGQTRYYSLFRFK